MMGKKMTNSKFWWISLCATAASIVIIRLAAAQTYGDINDVQYARNYDGDTITFNIKRMHPIIGKEIPVRVYGIDTPEIKGKCDEEKAAAIKLRDFVADELRGSPRIDLIHVDRDKYFRILADVAYVAQGKSRKLSEELIKTGLAFPYFGETKQDHWCGK